MTLDQDRIVRNQVMQMLQAGHVGMAEDLCRDHLARRRRDHEATAMLAQLERQLSRAGRLAQASSPTAILLPARCRQQETLHEGSLPKDTSPTMMPMLPTITEPTIATPRRL